MRYSPTIFKMLLIVAMQFNFISAWQMNVVQPPLYISTEFYQRFDDRYHATYDTGDTTSMKVDYYRWPILFTHKHGDVVKKGLVVLK